jgi:hypothetical protein
MEWYKKTQAEIEDFFLVKSAQGLDEKEALQRLAKFGKNTDPELRDEVAHLLRVTVIRSGQEQQIALQNLVQGDIVFLKKGDRVPADIRLVEVDQLQIDQSFFTNEGLSASKNTLPLLQDADLRKQKCMAFMGSFVTEGRGKGIVVARNEETQLFKHASFFKQRVKRATKKSIKLLNDLGVIVNNTKKASSVFETSIALFEVSLSNEMILELIRHLQMTHKLTTKFILEEKQAKHLSEVLGGKVVILREGISLEDLVGAQFLVADKKQAWLSRVSTLFIERSEIMLLVGDGREVFASHDKHVVSMLFGKQLSDHAICCADLISPKESPLILKSILYNKIKHKALDKIKK